MTRIWMLGLMLGSTPALADPVPLQPGPFELPDRIGPMRFDGKPHKYDDPRLGASYQYFGGGLSLTVYVYDLGAEHIPDGGDTRIACEAFEGAKGDVLRAGYENVVVKSEQLARLDPAADTPVAREAVFEYTRGGQPTVSFLWVTGAAREFVKLRFSINAEYRDEVAEARRTVLDVLGAALKPHLGPPDPEAGKQKTSMNINGGIAIEEMGTSLWYLAALGADSDKHPEIVPICGGDFVPDFGRELLAFQSALELGQDQKPTKLMRRLKEVAAAGFLDEFVWTYRHRDEWGTQPPDGLEPAAFDAWRKKKLRGFKMPDLGSVSFDTPRPLPLEPATPPAP